MFRRVFFLFFFSPDSLVLRSLELIALVGMDPVVPRPVIPNAALLCIGELTEQEVVLAFANVRMTRDFPRAGEFTEDDLYRATAYAARSGLVRETSITGSSLLRLLDIPVEFSTHPILGRVVEVSAFDALHGRGVAALALLHLMQTGSSGTCFLRSLFPKESLKMVLAVTSDAFVSVDLGTVSVRDAVMLVYGWHLASKRGEVDLSRVYPVEPAWPFTFRYMSQLGAMDELPINTLIGLIQTDTGLTFKVEGRQLLVRGLTSEAVADIVELLHLHVNRSAVDGMRTIVGFGALVNVGSSVPLLSWLLDFELLEILGAEALIGPCCWLWSATAPLLAIQLFLFARRAIYAES